MKKMIWWLVELLLAIVVVGSFLYFPTPEHAISAIEHSPGCQCR